MDLTCLTPLAHSAHLTGIAVETAADRVAVRGERPLTERRLRASARVLDALSEVMTLLSGIGG